LFDSIVWVYKKLAKITLKVPKRRTDMWQCGKIANSMITNDAKKAPHMIQTTQQQIVDDAMTSRHSMRAFLPTPIAREEIEQMFEVAARAPSGSNTQPWKAYVLTGEHSRTACPMPFVDIYNDKDSLRSAKRRLPLLPNRVGITLHRSPP
jgi:hypothetical protein